MWFWSTATFFSRFRLLSNTGGSPKRLRKLRMNPFLLVSPARLYMASLTRSPRILVLGFGLVRPCRSSIKTFLFFVFRSCPFILILAPVYNDSPLGRCFVLLHEKQQITQIKKTRL